MAARQTALTIHPIQNYNFGSKTEKMEKDATLPERTARHKLKYAHASCVRLPAIPRSTNSGSVGVSLTVCKAAQGAFRLSRSADSRSLPAVALQPTQKLGNGGPAVCIALRRMHWQKSTHCCVLQAQASHMIQVCKRRHAAYSGSHSAGA